VPSQPFHRIHCGISVSANHAASVLHSSASRSPCDAHGLPPSTNRHGSCREQVTCAMAMQRAQRQPSRVECQPFPTSASSHRLVGWVDRRVQRLSMGKPVAELWKGATQPLEPCHLGFAPQHYRKRRSSSFVQRQCKVRGTTHRDCCAKGQHFVA